MKRLTVFLFVVLSIAIALPAWAADFKGGVKAYKKHDYATAMKIFKANGSGIANYNIGIMYYNGQGVNEDRQEAVKWMQKAAEQGYVNAQFFMGTAYDSGEVIQRNLPEAAKWYRKAAEQGHVRSQYNLALMYTNGEGVEKNRQEAIKWLRKAAAQGHENAKKLLKVMDIGDTKQ